MTEHDTVAVMPTGMIRADQVTSDHVITRCIAAPAQYPWNYGIVIVFPPGTAITGQAVLRHAHRGSNLGTYTVISRSQIATSAISSRGLRFYSMEPS
jgi:hypothetical protein